MAAPAHGLAPLAGAGLAFLGVKSLRALVDVLMTRWSAGLRSLQRLPLPRYLPLQELFQHRAVAYEGKPAIAAGASVIETPKEVKIMPGGDRTGPLGAGPRTGRGMGDCSGYDRPGFANQATVFRGGFGFGHGSAGARLAASLFCYRHPLVNPPHGAETADLKAQADLLKAQLDAIQKRVEELTSQ